MDFDLSHHIPGKARLFGTMKSSGLAVVITCQTHSVRSRAKVPSHLASESLPTVALQHLAA